MIETLTAARLRELLHYDPATGVFRWRVERSGPRRVGDVAGSVGEDGYRTITVDGAAHFAHRLAWLYVKGEFPEAQVDHEDGARDHNAILNLRSATNAENCQNRALRSDSSTGLPGVSWHKLTGKWQARIGINGRRFHLGLFSKPEAAHSAYLEAKARIHEFQPSPRSVTGPVLAQAVSLALPS